jgi:hypothetical protein
MWGALDGFSVKSGRLTHGAGQGTKKPGGISRAAARPRLGLGFESRIALLATFARSDPEHPAVAPNAPFPARVR